MMPVHGRFPAVLETAGHLLSRTSAMRHYLLLESLW